MDIEDRKWSNGGDFQRALQFFKKEWRPKAADN